MRSFFEYSQGLNELATPPVEGMPVQEETPLPPDIEEELKGFPNGVAMPARRLFQFLSHGTMNKQKSVGLLNLMVQHISGDKLSNNLVRKTAMNAMRPQQTGGFPPATI